MKSKTKVCSCDSCPYQMGDQKNPANIGLTQEEIDKINDALNR
jgi:hypothetical protein